MGYGVSLLGLLFVLVWIIVVALVIAALVLAVRWLWRADQGSRYGRPGPGAPAVPGARPDDPLEILRGRYARGEIDDEEYERRRRTLGG
ncbi:MAG: SHOCT domain-containing protein [Candidatus Limnocylindrales bacterium]